MPFLYNNYCYEGIGDVSNALISQVYTPSGQRITSVDLSGENSLTVNLLLEDSGVSSSFSFSPPSCSFVGAPPFLGLSMGDAIVLGGLVSLALISIFSISVIKRAF